MHLFPSPHSTAQICPHVLTGVGTGGCPGEGLQRSQPTALGRRAEDRGRKGDCNESLLCARPVVYIHKVGR